MDVQSVTITTEKACALLAAQAAASSSYNATRPINIFTGTSNLDIEAPAIICWAESYTEDFPLSGIWHVKTNIEIKEPAADSSPDTIDLLIGDIQSAFLSSTIESDLQQKVSNYIVYQVLFDSSHSSVRGDAWIHSLGLDIVCTISA